jgi:hypothetical protein
MFAEFILAHIVGDYFLQNDYLAKNKKSSSFVCAFHVLIYILPFIAVLRENNFVFDLNVIIFLLLVCIQHFAIDRTNFVVRWMNLIGQRDFAKPPMAPWSIIIVDNSMHLIWVYLMFKLLVV